MLLVNQVFYISIALITFGLIFPAYVNLKTSRESDGEARYMFYTILAQFISALAFASFPLVGQMALYIGTASQYAVDVFLVLCFISLRKVVSKKLATILICSIGICPIIQQLDYAHRLIAFLSVKFIFLAWQLILIDVVGRKDKSIHEVMLAGLILLQACVSWMRIAHAIDYLNPDVLMPASRFEEPEHELLLRLSSVVLYVLTIIGISNFRFNKLWRFSESLAVAREYQLVDTLNALAIARDNESGQHAMRTREYVKLLADDLKNNGCFSEELTDHFCDALCKAAPLHDIGKIGVPDLILQKRGVLTPEESKIMKTHAAIGANILRASQPLGKNDVIDMGVIVAGTHHEHWDGSGYPNGLRGHQIPLAGRIMAVADVYDALTAKRKYKHSWAHEDATALIIAGKEVHFDPVIVEAFERVAMQFQHIAHKHSD